MTEDRLLGTKAEYVVQEGPGRVRQGVASRYWDIYASGRRVLRADWTPWTGTLDLDQVAIWDQATETGNVIGVLFGIEPPTRDTVADVVAAAGPDATAARPSLGRIVIYRGLTSNGGLEHPAIVTAVWSATCVNLTVFRDNDSPTPRTSVERVDPGSAHDGWFWPPRGGQ